MGKDQNNCKTEYDLDRLLRSSFGCDDDQLLEEMSLAEEMIDDSHIPPASEDSYKRLLAKIEQKEILMDDFLERESVKKSKTNSKKKFYLKTFMRVTTAASIVGSVFLTTSVTVDAKKNYTYYFDERYYYKGDGPLNNQKHDTLKGELDEAYLEIQKKVGMNVIRMNYMPRELKYLKTTIAMGHATMYFSYKDKTFCLVQHLSTEESSICITSNKKPVETIYNEWLGTDIVLDKEDTDEEEALCGAIITEGKSYYYISGVMPWNELKKIARNLSYMDEEETYNWRFDG